MRDVGKQRLELIQLVEHQAGIEVRALCLVGVAFTGSPDANETALEARASGGAVYVIQAIRDGRSLDGKAMGFPVCHVGRRELPTWLEKAGRLELR